MYSHEKKYTKGEITVVWKPDVCTHSKECWKNLRSVFDPTKRPWINMEGDTAEKIMGKRVLAQEGSDLDTVIELYKKLIFSKPAFLKFLLFVKMEILLY